VIEAEDLTVRLGARRILHGIAFTAFAGELTAIVGPNGSGKTTLLRALSGDVAFDGKVRMNGRDLSTLKPWQAAEMRAVLPQATSLSFPFTVREIVRLGLLGGNRDPRDGGEAEIVAQALARVDLAGFAGCFYQELSGGEQQRVQLARVLCQVWRPVCDGAPRFMLLDEPVSSLDIRHQLAIMDIARDFAAAGGGVIAILHDLNLAAMYADRVAVISDGRLAAFGAPREVLNDALLARTFGCGLKVGALPPSGEVFVLPHTARAVL
jgi:iron complex transport system ATP-binding protein